MASSSTSGSFEADRDRGEKLARAVSLAVGIVFLAVGVLGFVPGITTKYGDMSFAGNMSGAMLLGVFMVSVLHNIVHLLFGIGGIVSARRADLVPGFLIGSGVIYAVLTIYGATIDLGSSANLVPVNLADNWLHLVLAVALIGAAFFVGSQIPSRQTRATRSA